jgi:RNA polymerase sigma factor (sigma-70 family)
VVIDSSKHSESLVSGANYSYTDLEEISGLFKDISGRLTPEDLCQEAFFGIKEAEKRYDPKRASFETYSKYWVKHKILEAIYKAQPIPMSKAVSNKPQIMAEVVQNLPKENSEYHKDPDSVIIQRQIIGEIKKIRGRVGAVLCAAFISDEGDLLDQRVSSKNIAKKLGISTSRVNALLRDGKKKLTQRPVMKSLYANIVLGGEDL